MRAVAACLMVTMGACVAAPPRGDEKANLASTPAAPPPAPVGKAEACIPADPCVKGRGVWLPPDLAAVTAGWGEGLVACKASLATCNTIGVEPWVYVLVGVAGAVVGGFSVAGAYEFRDWLKK